MELMLLPIVIMCLGYAVYHNTRAIDRLNKMLFEHIEQDNQILKKFLELTEEEENDRN